VVGIFEFIRSSPLAAMSDHHELLLPVHSTGNKQFVQRQLRKQTAAEFFGTFILILFGAGGCAQTLVSTHPVGDDTACTVSAGGSYLGINFAWYVEKVELYFICICVLICSVEGGLAFILASSFRITSAG
jgi:hypothetical protein